MIIIIIYFYSFSFSELITLFKHIKRWKFFLWGVIWTIYLAKYNISILLAGERRSKLVAEDFHSSRDQDISKLAIISIDNFLFQLKISVHWVGIHADRG